jgi:flagellar hook-associated protein 3 FlgL
MRVTSNTFTSQMVDQLGGLASRQARLQSQAATGQRVVNPSDDPVAARRVLNFQAESRTIDQFQRNIAREKNTATLNFGVLKSLKKISDRASEIATLADGLKSPEELRIYAAQVGELIKQGVQLMNTKNGSNYLFGGTINDRAPFDLTVDAAGTPTAVSYQGNSDVAEVQVAEGVTLSAQAVGANTSGAGPRGVVTDTGSGADFFRHLIELQNNLTSGNTDAIANTDRANLQNDEDNIIFHMGLNGVVQGRLDVADATAGDRLSALDQRISGEVDADLAQTLVQLTQTQTAYQAALQSGAKVMQVTLLDYLR